MEANWASNWRCGNCKIAKGKCKATDVESDKRGVSPTTSLAEARAKNKKLEEQVEKLKGKNHKETVPVAKETPQEIKDINGEIRDIDKKKKALKAVDPSIRDDCGWDSQFDKLAQRREELLVFKQGLRPPDERKQAAGDYANKCKKWLDDANVATVKLDADMAEIRKKKIQHLDYVASCRIKLNKANLLKVAEEMAELAKEKAKDEGQQQDLDRAIEADCDAKRVADEEKRELAKMLAKFRPETLRELGIDAKVVENVKKQIVEPPKKEENTKTPFYSMASENGSDDDERRAKNNNDDDEQRAQKIQKIDRPEGSCWSPTGPLVIPASPTPGMQKDDVERGSTPTSPAPSSPGEGSGKSDVPMGETEGDVVNMDGDGLAIIIEQAWQTNMEVHKKDNDEDTHAAWVKNKEEWIAKHKEKLRDNEKNESGYAPY